VTIRRFFVQQNQALKQQTTKSSQDPLTLAHIDVS